MPSSSSPANHHFHTGSTQRDSTILGVSLLMSHFGTEWLFVDPSPQPKTEADGDGKEAKGAMTNSKFVSVTVNIVCVEARILLEDRELTQVSEENGRKLVVYFEILERVIMFLTVIEETTG